jgi:GNAT superfamily N-acetyltransferase
MRIVRARAHNAGELTAVAFAAKAHWGYPRRWLAQWTDILTVTPFTLDRYPTYVAVVGTKIVGFYSMRLVRDWAAPEHFWVLPAFIGRGVGRSLFLHFERRARKAAVSRIFIESDPNAEGFYRRMGAKRYSRRPAKMDGNERYLPLLVKALV